MTTPFRCPACGAPLELHDDAETEVAIFRQAACTVGYVEIVRTPAVIGLCMHCEFIIEVTV
jgi:hypothetical protein